ncbi:MAG TPA: hypothetical protein VE956_22260 [Nodularia sp. (in: cyanobacteria)]|nr:hypothetical protein [Nodularia sp. (in: cyanobacteria)]
MLYDRHELNYDMIKGFDLTGGMNLKTFINILFKGLNYQNQSPKSELFPIKINDDSSVGYLGKAVKL